MTKAQKFLKKFPDADLNDNVLTDIACGKCGSRTSFQIAYHTSGTFSDEGEDENVGDQEWDSGSYIRCYECDHSGTIKGFTFTGLDDLIEMSDRKSEKDG